MPISNGLFYFIRIEAYRERGERRGAGTETLHHVHQPSWNGGRANGFRGHSKAL